MAAVSVGGIYAFGGEVVEFLEVGVPVCAVDWKIVSKRFDGRTYITISFS